MSARLLAGGERDGPRRQPVARPPQRAHLAEQVVAHAEHQVAAGGRGGEQLGDLLGQVLAVGVEGDHAVEAAGEEVGEGDGERRPLAAVVREGDAPARRPRAPPRPCRRSSRRRSPAPRASLGSAPAHHRRPPTGRPGRRGWRRRSGRSPGRSSAPRRKLLRTLRLPARSQDDPGGGPAGGQAGDEDRPGAGSARAVVRHDAELGVGLGEARRWARTARRRRPAPPRARKPPPYSPVTPLGASDRRQGRARAPQARSSASPPGGRRRASRRRPETTRSTSPIAMPARSRPRRRAAASASAPRPQPDGGAVGSKALPQARIRASTRAPRAARRRRRSRAPPPWRPRRPGSRCARRSNGRAAASSP